MKRSYEKAPYVLEQCRCCGLLVKPAEHLFEGHPICTIGNHRRKLDWGNISIILFLSGGIILGLYAIYKYGRI